ELRAATPHPDRVLVLRGLRRLCVRGVSIERRRRRPHVRARVRRGRWCARLLLEEPQPVPAPMMLNPDMNDDVLSLSMFWAGLMMVFTPLIAAGAVILVWRRGQSTAASPPNDSTKAK